MNIYLRISVVLFVFLIVSCAFRGPLQTTTTIKGMNAFDTLLVVKSDYSENGTDVPKGNYYPSHEITSGYVVYKSGKPLKVNAGFAYLWAEDTCEGGIAVSIEDPQNDYFLHLEQCFGDSNLRIDLSKKLEFSVVRREQGIGSERVYF